MVYGAQFQVDRIPAVRVSSGLAIVIVTWDSDIQVPCSFRRREDGEQHRNSPPVGEEVTLAVMRPRILTEREITLDVFGEGELVALCGELAESSLGSG